jgi:hypothetical protein
MGVKDVGFDLPHGGFGTRQSGYREGGGFRRAGTETSPPTLEDVQAMRGEGPFGRASALRLASAAEKKRITRRFRSRWLTARKHHGGGRVTGKEKKSSVKVANLMKGYGRGVSATGVAQQQQMGQRQRGFRHGGIKKSKGAQLAVLHGKEAVIPLSPNKKARREELLRRVKKLTE